jgi:hypothetical protein
MVKENWGVPKKLNSSDLDPVPDKKDLQGSNPKATAQPFFVGSGISRLKLIKRPFKPN